MWYGTVWCGMVWCGMVWYGMVWYDMVWNDVYLMSTTTDSFPFLLTSFLMLLSLLSFVVEHLLFLDVADYRDEMVVLCITLIEMHELVFNLGSAGSQGLDGGGGSHVVEGR